MKLQKVAANPQHGLLTTLHETRTNLQFYHVSNTEVIVLFPSELIYQKINDMNDIFNTEKHLNLSSRQGQTQLYSSSERKTRC